MEIPTAISDPAKRYDFLILFDVTDGNPNGDPDAGNLPRVDPETMQGLVTDVCLKRKIRNFVDLTYSPDPANLDRTAQEGFGIFVRDSGIALNTKIKGAATDVSAKAEKKKENPDIKKRMCEQYYDIRMFGAVLSTGDYNAGQVRGPVQLTFSRSIDPVVPAEFSITRVAITKEGENKETEMGRKAAIPYGLYLGRGFYSPMLGVAPNGTGVSEADLKLFWSALVSMFENDRSAARGYMEMRGIYVFAHQNKLGNASSGELFKRLSVSSTRPAPREYSHYDVSIEGASLPEGVELVKLVG